MIKLLIDSAGDFTEAEALARGIDFLPMSILIDGEAFYDGQTITHKEFYAKLKTSHFFPLTSQISEYRFAEKIEQMQANGDQVLIICMSSKLSGTYEQAVRASENFSDVAVVDSLNVSVGERILIEYALRLIGEGKALAEVATALEQKKHKIKVLALLNTLEYLKKGGRISPLVAIAGAMLGIKPVVAVESGEVKLVGKAKGSAMGNNYLNKLIKNSKGIDFAMPYATGYTANNELLNKYVEDSKALWASQAEDIPQFSVGCTIGTHVGPNCLVVGFFEKDGE